MVNDTGSSLGSVRGWLGLSPSATSAPESLLAQNGPPGWTRRTSILLLRRYISSPALSLDGIAAGFYLSIREPIGVHYLLFYDVVPDYVERRIPFRSEHLALARDYHARGILILGGALANPVDGAVLLFRADSADVVTAFVEADPYVRNGLVTGWRIREWTTVVGHSP